MRLFRNAACCALLSLLAVGSASADVQLSIVDGKVTLVARDATIRQILTEWARVGQTRIVNLERIPGGPVTLELHGIPESQALDTLLRAVSGYMAAPRAVPVANASLFDRIIVMPTSAAPPAAAPVRAATPPPMFPQPQFQPGQPQFQPGQPPQQPANADDEDEAPPRGPVFNAFPPPQVVNQPQQQNPAVTAPQGPLMLPQPGTATGSPTQPAGVSVPGVIVQPPQPQQQGQPVIPGQPRRPGGPGGPGGDNR